MEKKMISQSKPKVVSVQSRQPTRLSKKQRFTKFLLVSSKTIDFKNGSIDSLLANGNVAVGFRLFVRATLRELAKMSVTTDFDDVARHAIRVWAKRIQRISSVVDAAPCEKSYEELWNDVPESERHELYFCATELYKLLVMIGSGGSWNGPDEQMRLGARRLRPEVDDLQIAYEWLVLEYDDSIVTAV